MGEDLQQRIDELARERFGIPSLYPIQRYVITGIIDAIQDANVLEPASSSDLRIVVMPTGAGKSVCFQLPALLLPGCTLVIYPLLGLMNDQERRMKAAGLRCAQLRGGQSPQERTRVFTALEAQQLDVLLSNPETLAGAAVRRRLARVPPVHAVIDEAHCIAEWGDSFRAAYLELGTTLRAAGVFTVSAFTATAGDRVVARVAEVLGDGTRAPAVYRGNPDRPGISYAVQPVLSVPVALTELFRKGAGGGTGDPAGPAPGTVVGGAQPSPASGAAHGRAPAVPVWAPGAPAVFPAIVFCNRRSATEDLARRLRRDLPAQHGVEVYAYHAGMPTTERTRVESAFFSASRAILFATCAYGMGVDKPDVRMVIHTYVPERPEAFLQESGRGGRDGQPAQSLILLDPEQQLRLGGSGPWSAVDDMIRSSRCRRESILSHFGVEGVACAGCDSCREQATAGEGSPGRAHAAGLSESPALSMIRAAVGARGPGFGPDGWAQILSGSLGHALETSGMHRHPAYGLLSGWSRWALADAISELVRAGILERRGRCISLPRRSG